MTGVVSRLISGKTESCTRTWGPVTFRVGHPQIQIQVTYLDKEYITSTKIKKTTRSRSRDQSRSRAGSRASSIGSRVSRGSKYDHVDAHNGHQHDDGGDGDTAMMITFYIKIFPVIYICLTPASPAISHFAPQVVPRRTRLWWSSGWRQHPGSQFRWVWRRDIQPQVRAAPEVGQWMLIWEKLLISNILYHQ